MLYDTFTYTACPVFTKRQIIYHRYKQADMMTLLKRIGWQENEIASVFERVTKKLSHLLTNKKSQS